MFSLLIPFATEIFQSMHRVCVYCTHLTNDLYYLYHMFSLLIPFATEIFQSRYTHDLYDPVSYTHLTLPTICSV